MDRIAPRGAPYGRRTLGLALGSLVVLALAHAALAVPKTYKYDQFSANIAEAATAASGIPLPTQPGFAFNEAWGQIYTPSPDDYPVQIVGIDMILAAAPNAPDLTSDARIELWYDEGFGAAPLAGAPTFSVSTGDLFNPKTNDLGFPLTGNAATSIDFDLTDPEGSPPPLTSGRVFVMVRYLNAATDKTTEWGTAQCASIPALGICGCQNTGTLGDQIAVPGVNVINHISPLGTCSGTAAGWSYADELGVQGDFILRLRVNTTGGCAPNCGGKVCGDDGCGGSCGTCPEGSECTPTGSCGPPPCVPDCTGVICGDNGCGGTCGTCPGGEMCEDGACVPEVCMPDCVGKACGDDGCDGTCGECGAGQICVDGICDVEPCVPDCTGVVCGDNGCGGTCGNCPVGSVCDEGQCVEEACVADCANAECGDDGCGGSCGDCEGKEQCEAGVCVDPEVEGPSPEGENADMGIVEINPAFGYFGEDTDVVITGWGFEPGMSVRLAGESLNAIEVESDDLMYATVPATLDVGMYLLSMSTPTGASATLPNAFEVRQALTSCGDGVCSDGESCGDCPSDCGSCGGESGGSSSGGCRSHGPQSPLGYFLILLPLVAIARRSRPRRR